MRWLWQLLELLPGLLLLLAPARAAAADPVVTPTDRASVPASPGDVTDPLGESRDPMSPDDAAPATAGVTAKPPVATGDTANAGGTILLVVDERARALATRVAAELEALGFRVVTQTQEPRAEELASEARRASAFAAIGVGPTSAGNVEITVLDRVTGKTVRRELLGRSLGDPTTRELVALRASELLRASLMEIEAPHPPRGDVPVTPPVQRVAQAPETIRRPEHRLRLATESGVLIAPGIAVAPLLLASLGAKVNERLELGVNVGSQLTPTTRTFQEGRVEAAARWLGFGPELLLLPRGEGRVALGVDAQLRLLWLGASGFASDAGRRGQSEKALSGALSGGIRSRIRVVKQLWWTLRPSLGFALRELSIRADGRQLRLWGRPWLECSTGVEVEL
jgi:hypothetical protein